MYADRPGAVLSGERLVLSGVEGPGRRRFRLEGRAFYPESLRGRTTVGGSGVRPHFPLFQSRAAGSGGAVAKRRRDRVVSCVANAAPKVYPDFEVGAAHRASRAGASACKSTPLYQRSTTKPRRIYIITYLLSNPFSMADTPIPHHATRRTVGRLRRERRFFPFFCSGALRASVVWRATLRRGRLSFVVPTLPLGRLPACGGLSVDL